MLLGSMTENIFGLTGSYTRQKQFPAQKCSSIKNVPHETGSLSEKVHGCRILPGLANIRCASQERATQPCDFSRIAAGKTIFCTFDLRTRQLRRS